MMFSQRDIWPLLVSTLLHFLMLALPFSEKFVPSLSAALPSAQLEVILPPSAGTKARPLPLPQQSKPRKLSADDARQPATEALPPAPPEQPSTPPPAPLPLVSPEPAETTENELVECSDSFGKALFDVSLNANGDVVSLQGQGENISTACMERLSKEIQAMWHVPENKSKQTLRLELDLGPTNRLLPQ